jgi:hypothetical protein
VKKFGGHRNYEEDYAKSLKGPCLAILSPTTRWKIAGSSRKSTTADRLQKMPTRLTT